MDYRKQLLLKDGRNVFYKKHSVCLPLKLLATQSVRCVGVEYKGEVVEVFHRFIELLFKKEADENILAQEIFLQNTFGQYYSCFINESQPDFNLVPVDNLLDTLKFKVLSILNPKAKVLERR